MIGPMAMASIFDRTGSYDAGLMLLPVFPLLAIGLLQLAKPLMPDKAAQPDPSPQEAAFEG